MFAMNNGIEKGTITKILLSRRLYHISLESLDSTNELSLSIGVILLQDSVEIFLRAVSDQVKAAIKDKTSFDQYFNEINKKLAPVKLPFESRLTSLNKLRVNAKHYGMVPSKSETDGLISVVKEFFEEVSIQVFKREFVTISLVDLLNKGEEKNLLLAAEEAYSTQDYNKVLLNCRKALYVEIEHDYDISLWKENNDRVNMKAFLLRNKTPLYARNSNFIDKFVTNPTDYIVYDHDKVNMDILLAGMSNRDFWNVLILTPAVYRKDNKSEWIIKQEFHKFDEEGKKDRATYVLDSTINLVLAKHSDINQSKSANFQLYYVKIKRESVPIYAKADKNSTIIQEVPNHIKKVTVDFKVPSLTGDGIFWHILYFTEDVSLKGYIDGDDIEEFDTE